VLTPPMRRLPHPASPLGREFDAARFGGALGMEGALVLFEGRAFALSDLSGGRSVIAVDEHGCGRQDQVGNTASTIALGRGVEVRHETPETGAAAVSTFDGHVWRHRVVPPGPQGPQAPTAPNEPVMKAKRISPGLSACSVTQGVEGALVGQWQDRVIGTPILHNGLYWYLREAWPSQELTARTPDGRETHRITLPPGLMGSLASDGDRAAAVWTTPNLPAACVISDSFESLAREVIEADERTQDPDLACFTPGTAIVQGVPTTVLEPVSDCRGTLVLLHGGPHATSWPVFSPLATYLCRRGWRVVAPNICSSSLADRYRRCDVLGVDDAAEAAALYAEFRRDGPVVGIGWSYGAYAAARSVGLGGKLDGLVSVSGFLSVASLQESRHPSIGAFTRRYRLPEVDLEALAGMPMLVVHGAQDERVPIETQERIARRLPECEFVGLPLDGHGIGSDFGAAVAYPRLADWLGSL